MQKNDQLDDATIRSLIRQKKIHLGGNSKLRIYGILSCRSGKKMKRENRVFFASEEDAIANGYRPCAHCMRAAYQNWKNESVQ
ncbi:MAG: metal-binding protein [Chitinophagaceae bacterium]|nr:MAG: metal-binding protein [Chitinophagaceae bacterium]